MLSLTKEERLVLICLGLVAFLGLSGDYLLKTNSMASSFLNITDQYHRYLRRDVNQATYDELVAIPGLGPQIAKRVLAARESQGVFKDIHELRKISGVGNFKFQIIQKYLMVAP